MEKNGIYTGTVSGLGTEGEGIIKTEGTTAFVPFCLTGEKVTFKALKVKGDIAYGKAESIENEAYCRTEPKCKVFKKCGGCALQHMDYKAQLKFKRELVANALKKIGGIDSAVDETVACGSEYRYRNKLSLPVGETDGKIECGFYGLHSHRIVPADDCPIQSVWVKNVIAAIKKFSLAPNICAFDEQTGRGNIRRIVAREIGGKFLFVLVSAKRVDVKPLISALDGYFGEYSLWLNINANPTNSVFSDEWELVKGEGKYDATEFNIEYSAGANTFLQVNDDVREKLYSRVLEQAEEGAAAIDLYSGAGLLTAMLAKKCGMAYGIEIVPEASRMADELKKANALDGKMFNICGKVEEKLTSVLKDCSGRRKIIVCDPPRKGMERSVVKAIRDADADKVILISCNPSTLARDLGLLAGTLKEEDGKLLKNAAPASKYCLVSVTPFDMFPQTKHVETLAVLRTKNATDIST